MRKSIASLGAVLVVLAGAGASYGVAPPESPVTREYLSTVRTETGNLTRSLENLQEAIVQDLSDQKERAFYNKADAALTALEQFESSMKDNVSRQRLDESFRKVDGKIRDLLDAVDGLGVDARALHREAARVRSASKDLYFTVSAGDSSAGRRKLVLKRQAARLLVNARELERTAQYALIKMSGQTSPGDFQRLVEASARFQKSVDAGASPEQLRKDFAEVGTAWQKAVLVLKAVKPGENLYLIRAAARLDRQHARLHRLLDIKSDRAGLTVDT